MAIKIIVNITLVQQRFKRTSKDLLATSILVRQVRSNKVHHHQYYHILTFRFPDKKAPSVNQCSTAIALSPHNRLPDSSKPCNPELAAL